MRRLILALIAVAGLSIPSTVEARPAALSSETVAIVAATTAPDAMLDAVGVDPCGVSRIFEQPMRKQ